MKATPDGRPALRVPGRRCCKFRKGAIVIVANSERERDDWIIALRVRIAPWQTLAQRAIELVRSEGPESAIVRDLGRTIFDELASKQPLTAQPMRDVGASAHPKIIAAISATIDLLTLLQLPLIEVGNAVRADCYSIASYP